MLNLQESQTRVEYFIYIEKYSPRLLCFDFSICETDFTCLRMPGKKGSHKKFKKMLVTQSFHACHRLLVGTASQFSRHQESCPFEGKQLPR